MTPRTVIPAYRRLSVMVGCSCLCPWCAAFVQLLVSKRSWELSPLHVC